MNYYVSTRNENVKATPAQAVLKGLAPDGGLFVPDDLDSLKVNLKAMMNMSYREQAKVVFSLFFPDLGEQTLSGVLEKSYENKFDDPEVAPLVKVGDAFVLELFHGPTCAFKDVALSALPNLMTASARHENFRDHILILVATSGDTGSSALTGFSNVEGTDALVFYPEDGISQSQRLQMVTQSAPNVKACAIRGNFDAAQTGVKNIFRSVDQPAPGVSLSSANSINIGRLVPQIVYYFHAYKDLLDRRRIHIGDEVTFIVPTGNFGDIFAGWFARKMGLPVGRLVCASNENDVLTEFLTTGHYNKKREFHKTTSPSMDILVSSNLERLLYFVCGSQKTAQYMEDLRTKGEYQISDEELLSIQGVFGTASVDSARSAEVIRENFQEDHYLMDPHTAVAWGAMEKLLETGELKEDEARVVLSTASPYKFSRSMLKALGQPERDTDEENMNALQEYSGVAAPDALLSLFSKEVLHKDVIDAGDMQDYVIRTAENCRRS